MNKVAYIFCALSTLDIVLAIVINSSDLKLVNVVFRHGDRAPDPTEIYPNDPHYNDSFFPIGLGGMTNAGKLREYNLGKFLRNRYNDFLGDAYNPEFIVARSTDYKRTKMCLQLILSALFPPKGKYLWNRQLNWQPIPITYALPDQDWLLIPEECPEYIEERKRVENMPEIREKIEKFSGFMNDLSEWTGKNFTVIYDMCLLYFILTAESSMNLELPQWTHDIFPDGKLLDGILLEYEIFGKTNTLKRLNGGKLLYKIIESMQTAKNSQTENSPKVVLYSGHESNIVALMQTLGIFKPHTPEYTSAVIVELYEKNNQYYVQVLYYHGIPPVASVQRIPGCDEFCPLSKFINLLRDVTPSPEELACKKAKKLGKQNLL